MTAALSNLVSNAQFAETARSSSRSRLSSTESVGRFDQVLEKSVQTREKEPVQNDKQPEKTDKNEDDNVVKPVEGNAEQSIDDQQLDEDVQVDDDDQYDIDEQEASQGGVVAEAQSSVMQQVAEQAAQQTQATPVNTATDASTNPLLEAASEQTQNQQGSSQKHDKDVADAMLRMLGITSGQGATQSHQATFTLNDTLTPVLQANSTSDQPANQQQLQLPDTQSSQQTDAANVSRVSRALANAVNQKGGTITIRMMPPELGQVKVDIQMQGGKVSASFQTEHQSVQTLMNRELSQLRQALERQGLTVEKLEVTHRSANSSNANASGQDQQQSPSDGRSRGQYARQDSGSQDATEFTNSKESQTFATQLDSQL
jgi:hypothetical protein